MGSVADPPPSLLTSFLYLSLLDRVAWVVNQTNTAPHMGTSWEVVQDGKAQGIVRARRDLQYKVL